MAHESILIVEDEAVVALDMKLQLQELGYAVVGVASSGEQALALVAAKSPQLILMDVRLQGPMDGIEAAAAIRREHDIPVIYLTSHSDASTVQRAADTGPYGYLTKPYQLKELRAGIEVALSKAHIERQLRASEERFRVAFEHAPLGMALVSLTGEFMQINAALCRLLRSDLATLEPLNQSELTFDADREAEAQHLRELSLKPDQVAQYEKRYVELETGTPVWVLVSVSLLRDGTKPICQLFQVHDLSQQKLAAQQAAELADERLRRQASELASVAKSEFLSRVSHEMRTPLNAVLGFAQLLQFDAQAASSPKVHAFATQIHSAGSHMLALVNDLLDLSSASQGKLQLSLQSVALTEALAQAQALVEAEAHSRGIALALQIGAGHLVQAEPRRLRQVLLNVLSNAIKYNRQGGRVVATQTALPPSASEPRSRVRLVIEDSGIGMTAEQLARLFQPFDRLGAEYSTVRGTGLGLVIARSLVEAMGGTLNVTSTVRQGTQVSIELTGV
jgi:PAS domain S-box-containing protein